MDKQENKLEKNKVKKNVVRVYVTDEVKEYLDKQSDAFGMSISGYMNMCLANYRRETETLARMTEMQDVLYQLKELELKGALVSKGMKVKYE